MMIQRKTEQRSCSSGGSFHSAGVVLFLNTRAVPITSSAQGLLEFHCSGKRAHSFPKDHCKLASALRRQNLKEHKLQSSEGVGRLGVGGWGGGRPLEVASIRINTAESGDLVGARKLQA